MTRGAGVPGKTAATWAVAGGVGFGGFLVGLMTLSGQLSGNGLLVTSSALFIIGALLGFMHGAVLGLMGRPADMTWRDAVPSLALGALYTVPALAVAFLVSGWIAMTPIALYTGKVLAIAGCTASWLVGAVLLGIAAVNGLRALHSAYARWDEKTYGTAIVAASFAALLVLFLAERPTIWGIDLRVTPVGAVLLALSMTLWLIGPTVTLALKAIKKLGVPVVGAAPRKLVPDVVIGLVAGVVLGMIALPFQVAPRNTVLVALSAAFVNEIVLRLVAVSAIAYAVLKRSGARRGEGAAVAVAAATILQVLLYLPSVISVGFPTTVSAIAFTITAVALPAAVFGTLFWKRGLTTAIIADATALIAIALFAA